MHLLDDLHGVLRVHFFAALILHAFVPVKLRVDMPLHELFKLVLERKVLLVEDVVALLLLLGQRLDDVEPPPLLIILVRLLPLRLVFLLQLQGASCSLFLGLHRLSPCLYLLRAPVL